jgi:indole-3-glycerol phosphate synthase
MTIVTGTYLDRILAQTVIDVEERKRLSDEKALADAIGSVAPALPFAGNLRQENVSVIAEFKRASPSRGRFPVEIDPIDVASAYVDGGARGISCLTDGPFFQGSLDDLDRVVSVAHATSPPVGVLRKDFMVDPFQIVEARAHGADCILLIVAALDDRQLVELREQAEQLGMSVLVEVHDKEERDRALASGATLLGVNNRNLKTFEVSLDTTARVGAELDPNVTLVAESGIFTEQHVAEMARIGASAVLVGESLIVQDDRAAAVRALAGIRR